MSESTSVERQPSLADAPYEAPKVIPVGNLNDLLLGATGPLCDAGDLSNRVDDMSGTC